MKSKVIQSKKYNGLSLVERATKLFIDIHANEDDIRCVIDLSNEREQILVLASLIYNKIKDENGKAFALSHITSGTLAYVFGAKEDNSRAQKNFASKLGKIFVAERKFYSRKYDIDFTASEVVRLITFENNEGRKFPLNAKVAREQWGDKVEFSYSDLIRGVRVPSMIDDYVATYLGMLTIGASMYSKNRYRIYFNQLNEGASLYDKVISKLNKQLFNINCSNGENSDFEFYSKAIYTWLTNCIGMEPRLKDRTLIKFKNLDNLAHDEKILNDCLFSGIVAKAAHLYEKKEGFEFKIYSHKNKKLLRQIKDLVKDDLTQKYNPDMPPESGRGVFTFNYEDFYKFLKNKTLYDFNLRYIHLNLGGFINPDHIDQIRRKYNADNSKPF